jgi:hypothetical protein
MCGYDTFEMRHLANFVELVRCNKFKAPFFRLLRDSRPARLSRDHDFRQRTNIFLSLLGLCSEYGESLCQDSRDKIFGLHRLASTCCSEAVPVDYRKSTREIYQAVLRHYVSMHSPFRGTKNEIEMYQRFHEALGITPYEILTSPPHDNQELKAMNIQITGKLNGRILHVSPFLDQAGTDPGSLNLPFPLPHNVVLQSNIAQLKHLTSVMNPQGHSVLTRELDLVRSFRQASNSINHNSLLKPRDSSAHSCNEAEQKPGCEINPSITKLKGEDDSST